VTDAPLGERTDERWPLLSRFREHGVPNARYIAVGMVGPVGTAMFGAMMPFVLGTVFDALFNEQPYALPLVPSAWIPTEPAAQVWFTGALLATLYVARAVVNTTGQYYRGLFGIKVQHDLRVAAYEALQRRRLSFFDDQQTGELMSVLNSDVSTLENFFSDAAPLFVFRVATLGWALLFMSLLNVRLALLGLVGAPLLVVLNLRFARRMEHAQDRARQAVGDLNATMGDYVGGISLIKTGTAEPQASATVAKRSRENFDRQWGLRKLRTAHRPAVNLVADATYLLVFLVGGYWVLRGPPPFAAGTLTGGELIAFLLYARQLVGPFAAITRTIDQYESAKASAKRVAAVTTAGSGGVDPDAGHPLADVDGRVEYDDVTFGYGDDPVLEDVSFEVAAGETVGVVGPTGAGKSTLLKLLLRFYDADEGAVRLDGHDVRDVALRDLRGAIGYVSQDPYLFDGTVRENIAYGDPDADADDVVRAAKLAEVHEFAASLPEGYDTEVGERGVKLSGGQRQRVAIARAILGDPAVLILDEATSHVDNETEVLIQASLSRIAADRTTFVVAHRLSTVKDADEILALDDGEVVERGTHEELLEADGLYATLWAVQVGDIEALPESFRTGAGGD